MPTLSPHLASIIRAHHGIVTRYQLLDDGLTDHQVRRLVEQHQLERCHNGVYRVATSPDSFHARCAAACAADPSIVVTGAAAGSLWGFRHVRRPDRPIVLVEHDRHPLAVGATVRRTNVLDDADRVTRPDGIVVATPPRTWFDIARDVSDETFEAGIEWTLVRHVSLPTLWAMLRRMSARGRPGLARVNRVLSQRSRWQRPAGSKLELRVLSALERAGVPELIRQHPIRLPNGIVIHPDGVDLAARWAIEVDHITWHGGRADAQRDKGRDRGLRRLGWQVDRVTDRELADDFDGVVRELVALHSVRSVQLAA